MTDDVDQEPSVEPVESSRVRRTLDELHRWRFFILGALLIVVAVALYVGVSIPWSLIGITVLSLLVSIGIGAIVAMPIAARRARPPEQVALVVLDPQPRDLRFAIRWFGEVEASDLQVTWGSLIECPVSTPGVSVRIALTYDEEAHAARGTWRSTKDPDELLRTEYRLDEYYGAQEVEAAGKQTLEHKFRSAVRRATMALTAHQDRVYDEATIPKGETLTEVLNEIMPEPEDADKGDLQDEDEPVDEEDELDVDLDDDLPEPVGALEPAVTDGGQNE